MNDGQGRKIDYVRISLTDRCSLRCIYCMPEAGVETVSHTDILTFDEIERLVQQLARLGIRKIKLTGGEPLVRKGVPQLVKNLKQIPGIEQVTITTNGVCLAGQMEALAEAGIDGINLSLDTLDPEVFFKITRRHLYEQVMEGFQKALEYEAIPLKINCVPLGMEGQDLAGLAQLAKNNPVHVRFIEMMPIGMGEQFACHTEQEILSLLCREYGEAEGYDQRLGNGPGHYYSFPGFQGKIGFISAVSHKFCASCNRVRLTSQGYLKTCLQYDTGVDLRALLRGGASDREIEQAVEEAIRQKPAGHQFGDDPGKHKENHTMSQIGG